MVIKMFYYDSTYLLVIIGAVLTIVASARVNSTFNKYKKVRSATGMTGAEAARRLLNNAGISDVSIEHISGNLTDHYDPSQKVLRLSDATYGSSSVAAIGVAAHECGHAIQHYEGYIPLKIRSTLVPAANIGSRIGIPICILGMLLSFNQTLITVGIWVFSFAVLFQIVTLPVEFNASSRAIRLLDETGILYGQEIKDTKRVLGAAALTYVAAAAASILQLLRLVLIFGGRDRD
jgi:Zn-dependent membrane protease YugP